MCQGNAAGGPVHPSNRRMTAQDFRWSSKGDGDGIVADQATIRPERSADGEALVEFIDRSLTIGH